MKWFRDGIRQEIADTPRWGRILGWIWLAVYTTEIAATIIVGAVTGNWHTPLTILQVSGVCWALCGTLAGTILWLTRKTS